MTWWDNEVNITFSGANLLKTEIKEHEDEYEWIYYYNFTSSEHVPFSKIESNKKLEQQGASVVVDGIKISFEDAIERGFDVTPIELDTKTQAFALQIPEENINATLGEVIEIDPVIELQNAPNVTDDAFIRKNMSSVPTYQRFTTQASIETGIFGCATTNFSVRSYYDFNLSSIPDNVVISQVNLTVRIGTIDDDSDMLNATQMNQPGGSYSNDATGNAAAFNDMENISYAQVRVTANSVQSFILGSTANTNLQANLTTGDTFSVGLRTKETGDAFGATCSPFNDRTVTRINSTEDATVASRPKLSVSYDLSPPEVILNAPANNTLFTILGNITLNATVTDKNDALIDEVVFFGDNNALPSSSDILSIQLNVTNGTALTYNWTAPVIQLEGGTTLLLIHFDNRSIFGENTTVVNDYSNYNFDGVIGDAIFNWTTSVLGGAYRFDGTNDNITFGDQDALIGFNRTYLMWINPISVSGTQTILDKLTGGDGFRIDASNSDVIVRSDAETITASNFLNLSTYVHLAITMNATGYTTIYRNGVSHTRGQFTSMSANNVNFILGETASGTQDFNGLLDELAIVNRTYSAIDVRNAFRIGSGIYYWNVNATDGLDYNTSLTFTFNISISDPPTITLNNPPNGTTYTGIGNITLDVTIDDVNQDNLTLELFGTNTTSPLPENLLFRRSSIIPASSFVYNWTAPVLQLDTDYQLLAHLNNQSIFIENNTRVYNFADPTRNGTLEGGMLVNMTGGMLGGALEGRQTNGQYLDFGNQNAWVNLGNLTWMAWVKAYDITGDEGIISKGRTSQIPAADLTVRKVASNLIVETGSTNPINATNFFTVNEWVHFAVVFTNSVNITFYRNGVELNRSTNTSIVGNNDEFVIGNFESTDSTFNNPFNGLIDEVAIINRSLTATEVLDAYRLRGNTYNWFGNVTDGTNQISSSQRSFRIDAIPSVSVGPTLTPSPANTTDQFTCTFTVTDTDPNDGLSANISFFNGTRLELSFNISVTKDSQATQTATLGIQAKMENWTCGVVPFDGIAEGNLVNSTNVSVVNSPPTRPTLTNPVNNNVTTDTTPFFNWTPVTDPDNDVINYTLNITCLTTSGGACPTGDDSQQIDNINISNYTMTDDLDFFLDDGFRYNWTVRATDGQNTSSFAQPFNITFVVVVDINLSNSSIDFGSTLSPGDAESTQDRSPAPLKLDNIGNAFVNVNISSNNFLFTTLTSQSTNYMFRINDSGGQLVTPFNTTESIVNFTNVTTTNRTAIVRFNETATANIDINITVPSDEPSGLKTSVLNLVAWYPGR